MSKRRPPVVHASSKGYPACGAKQRAWDVKNGIEGDVVSGEWARERGSAVDCGACLRLERALAEGATP